MKYFTPDLLTRYGSLDDRVADAADIEWEAATEKYQKHFRSIQRHLPNKLRGLLRRYSLHDAKVCFAGVDNQVLHLTLQLDSPPRETIFLRYRLVSEVKMVANANAGQESGQSLTWLYDEVDIASEGVFPIVEQRVLFSNGLELSVQFQDLSYATARTLPLIANGVAGTVRVEMAKQHEAAYSVRLDTDNPTLLRLRKLEAVGKIATGGKLSVVLGEKGLADRIVNLI